MVKNSLFVRIQDVVKNMMDLMVQEDSVLNIVDVFL